MICDLLEDGTMICVSRGVERNNRNQEVVTRVTAASNGGEYRLFWRTSCKYLYPFGRLSVKVWTSFFFRLLASLEPFLSSLKMKSGVKIVSVAAVWEMIRCLLL